VNELKTIENQIDTLMIQISDAASRKDLPAMDRLPVVERLYRKASELREIKDQVAVIQQRIEKLACEDPSAAPSPATEEANRKLRELPMEVTKGMIRQNLLTLTPHIKRGKVKLGEEFRIKALPGGENFETVLLEKGNKLRARGPIARFYQDAQVQDGDYVLLTEIAHGQWELKKAPFGEYGASRLIKKYVGVPT